MMRGMPSPAVRVTSGRRASVLVRATLLIALAASIPLAARLQTPAPTASPAAGTAAGATAGTVERIKVHGTSLEGSLLGDSPDRDVAVFLPPSYKTSTRRFPVVYMLHGFTDNVGQWWGDVKHFVNVPEAIRQTLGDGGVNEMILVMPNALTRFGGGFYSSSAATGDWETFVSKELVAYIDKNYRTLAAAESRGLFGHSMGGYGAIRIGMRHPDVFSSVYAMSSCCLTPPSPTMDPKRMEQVSAITDPDQVAKADFGTKAFFATAAAWSPNPANPPLFVDLPVKDGQMRPEILAKWSANSPIAMADQYIGNLKRLRAIAFDVGTKDRLAPGSLQFHEILDTYKVPHTYETYDGDHLNRIHERLRTKAFPFFSKHLADQ
jgi:S-formylglutathione hydrolase FrmB